MALNIDVHERLRRPADLMKLVEAVLAGKDEDEADWIEWKSTLELTTLEGAFNIARQILGSANRFPEHAGRFMQGLGYVIVGAAPGSLDGVTPLDLAKLDAALEKYLGNPGPTWGGTYVDVQGKTVLVVIVEAPRWGDPIYSLAKTFQPASGKGGASAGTIFMRRQARTRPAEPGDIQLLQDRLVRGQGQPQRLDLAVDWPADDAALLPLDLSDEAIEEWIALRREAVVAMEPPPEEETKDGPSRLQSVIGKALSRDPRSREQYLEEVEAHLEECRSAVKEAVFSELLNQRVNLVALRVSNTTVRNLPDVELTLRIEARAAAFEEERERQWRLPKPPRAHGSPSPSFFGFPDAGLGSVPAIPGLDLFPTVGLSDDPADVEIDNDSSVVITLQLGRLRPHGVKYATPFVLLTAEDPDSTLTMNWTATSTRVDARQEGELTLQVSTDVLTPLDLIPYAIDGQFRNEDEATR
ncbi:hypothetical protein [Geodermatophilus amargosae]|uniref:hypothetical protein n=1 Tax=Geodermatophilus amargosae TaxID=1296565 RepID=UPI0034DF3A74